MDENNNLIKKINEFQKFVDITNDSLLKLADSVSSFGENIKEIKNVELLNDELNSLDSKIKLLNNYSSKLDVAFNDIEKFDDLEQQISNTNNNFKLVKNSLIKINDMIVNISSDSSNFSIDKLVASIKDVSDKFEDLNKQIKKGLIDYIENILNNNIDSLKNEIMSIKNSFDEYKKQNELLIQELVIQNETLQNSLNDILNSNQQIMNLFKNVKEQNKDINEFMNNYISKWYENNVSFLGIRKNKKGE